MNNNKIEKIKVESKLALQQYKFPYYVMVLPKSAEQVIIKKYGDTKVSQNIINMFNKFFKLMTKQGKRIYDYTVLSSNFYRKEIKNSKIRATELLPMFLEPRIFNDGTKFRYKGKSEAKHYRLKSSFIRKHGIGIKNIGIELNYTFNEPYYPLKVESGTNKCLDRIYLPFELLQMTPKDIERELKDATLDRFNKKVTKKKDKVICSNKRFDFELCFNLMDFNIYQEAEVRLSSYRMYNSLIKLIYGQRRSLVNENNHRLNHLLLQVPKEALRYIRVDGEALIEFDLKNSQPCLLMNLLFGSLNAADDEFGIIMGYIEAEYNKLLQSYNKDVSLKSLIRSSYRGHFYEMLQEISDDELSREEAKMAVMFILFSAFNAKWNPSVEVWKENLPKLYYFIREIKKVAYQCYKEEVIKDNNPEKLPYESSVSYLSVMLQKLESSIFIDLILVDLYDQDLFAITKHDAILCKESDKDKVLHVMSEHLDNRIGIDKYMLNKTSLCKDCYSTAA